MFGSEKRRGAAGQPGLITDAQWAKMSQRAKRRHLRKAWGEQFIPRRRVSAQRAGSVLFAVAMVGAMIVIAWHPWSTQDVLPWIGPRAHTSEPAPVDLTRPFTTTPAAGWADGAAGIEPPAATPVGPYSAAQVADAMNTVKQALIAGHLDNRALVDHEPSGYLAFFAPDARAQDSARLTGPDNDGELTLLAPGFHLLPVPIKVNGTMSTSADAGGYLVIHANYVLAYAFVPHDPAVTTDARQMVVVEHFNQDFDVVVSGPPADQGLWLGSFRPYIADTACNAAKQGLIAPAYSDPNPNPVPSAAPTEDDNLYDPNHGMQLPNRCPGT